MTTSNSRLVALALFAIGAPVVTPLLLTAAAQAPAELGLPVGQKAPAVAGTTQAGAAASFASLKGQKGMVLAFVRSAEWCPFCQNQLKGLNAVAADLKAAGYPLTALSYDDVAILKKFSDRNSIGYTLLSDPASQVIDAFGVRNEEVRNNKRMNGIPHPVIFVIDADGTIRAKLYEEGYKTRPTPEALVETVKGLK